MAELQQIPSEAQNYRTLESDDPRPLQQLQLIRDSWRKPGPVNEQARLATVRFFPPALAVVTALRDVMEEQIDNGKWDIRVEHGRYRCQRTNASTRPPILDLAQRAVTHADELAPLVPRPQSLSAILSPQFLLADHLRARYAFAPRTIGS